MAITRAQQVKQMLRDGGVTEDIGFSIAKPSKNGLRPGYRRANYDASGGGLRDSSPGGKGPERQGRDRDFQQRGESKRDYQKTSKQYRDRGTQQVYGAPQKIADAAAAEFKKNLKIKEQQEKERKQRILEEQRRKQQEQLGILGRSTTTRFGNPNITGKFLGEDTSRFDKIETLKSLGAIEEDDEDDAATAKAIGEQSAIEKFLGKIPSTTNILKNILPKDPFGNIIGEITDDPELLEKVNKRLGIDLTEDAGKKKYSQLRTQGVIGAYGRPMGGFREGPVPGSFTSIGGEGPDNQIIPQVVPTTTAPTTTATTSEDEDIDDINRGLAARFGGSLFDFDFDNLRANAMDGGIMNTDVIGGFADDSMDEMGRQMYGLGKLVKKVTKGVKKIVKSPIGKAAILGAVGFGIPGVKTGFFSKGLMGTKTGLGLKKFLTDSILGEATMKQGFAQRSGGLLKFLKSPMGLITGSSVLAGALTPKQKQELQQEEEDDFDLIASRDNPFKVLAPRFEGSQFAADGGRIGYQEGGDAEPVAKKTMPLIDMDGMEKDYRETGGFVEMGRMERADDVPARLSKNEFVFTADAVRNAGDGNIDKGAEVMYNMMKNLESGGEVSEESQGLEGARKMFQTSQRLGEVV